MCACICIQLHLPTSSQLASFYQCNFFLTLGQLCGFGACNQLLHKIPSYPSHFRKARTAGQGAIKGLLSQPPAVASSPGLHLPSSSLYAVISIHLFRTIFSLVTSCSLLSQFLSKLTKSGLFNISLNEMILAVSVISLLVLCWTALLLLFPFGDGWKWNYTYHYDVLHFKFFLQDDYMYFFIQLHETGFLNCEVFVCCWFGL